MGIELRGMDMDFYQGNPGCMVVAGQLEPDEVRRLDGMGLRGSAVWIAFKDVCGSDIGELRRRIGTGEIEAQVKATPDWQYEHGGPVT